MLELTSDPAGGLLVRELLAAALVDEVDTTIIPIRHRAGVSFPPPPSHRPVPLVLAQATRCPRSGILNLRYRLARS